MLFTLSRIAGVDFRPVIVIQNRPVELTVSEVLRENTLNSSPFKRLELKRKTSKANFITERSGTFLSKNVCISGSNNARRNDAVLGAVRDGFKPFQKQLSRELSEAVSISSYRSASAGSSLFNVNKHHEDSDESRAKLMGPKRCKAP